MCQEIFGSLCCLKYHELRNSQYIFKCNIYKYEIKDHKFLQICYYRNISECLHSIVISSKKLISYFAQTVWYVSVICLCVWRIIGLFILLAVVLGIDLLLKSIFENYSGPEPVATALLFTKDYFKNKKPSYKN